MNYPYTIKKQLRLIKRLGIANPEVMKQIKIAWQIAFGWD